MKVETKRKVKRTEFMAKTKEEEDDDDGDIPGRMNSRFYIYRVATLYLLINFSD